MFAEADATRRSRNLEEVEECEGEVSAAAVVQKEEALRRNEMRGVSEKKMFSNAGATRRLSNRSECDNAEELELWSEDEKRGVSEKKIFANAGATRRFSYMRRVEEKKIFVEKENFVQEKKKSFVEEEKLFVEEENFCRREENIFKEEKNLFVNADTTCWPKQEIVVEELEEQTSSLSSPMVTDHYKDTKAQPVMLSPAANNRNRNREILAQDKRKNESDE